jgi:hypothetical protein
MSLKLKKKDVHLVSLTFAVDLNQFEDSAESIRRLVTGIPAEDIGPDLEAITMLVEHCEEETLAVTCKQEKAVKAGQASAAKKVDTAPVSNAGPIPDGHCSFCRTRLDQTGMCFNIRCEAYVPHTTASLKAKLDSQAKTETSLTMTLDADEAVDEEIEALKGEFSAGKGT